MPLRRTCPTKTPQPITEPAANSGHPDIGTGDRQWQSLVPSAGPQYPIFLWTKIRVALPTATQSCMPAGICSRVRPATEAAPSRRPPPPLPSSIEAERSVAITRHVYVLFTQQYANCTERMANSSEDKQMLRMPKAWLCPRWITLLLYATLRLLPLELPVISLNPTQPQA